MKYNSKKIKNYMDGNVSIDMNSPLDMGTENFARMIEDCTGMQVNRKYTESAINPDSQSPKIKSIAVNHNGSYGIAVLDETGFIGMADIFLENSKGDIYNSEILGKILNELKYDKRKNICWRLRTNGGKIRTEGVNKRIRGNVIEHAQKYKGIFDFE